MTPPNPPPDPTATPADTDEFRYGWRYVKTTGPGGTVTLERVPLTLLDVLHPQEEDFIIENSRHERHRRHFHNVFERRLSRDATVLTLSDCRIEWGIADLGPHGPDLIVLKRKDPWPWRTWTTVNVAQERARPLLVVELVSPNTRDNDVVANFAHYHRAGVSLYVLVDQLTEDGPLRLVGYRHTPAGYVPISLDERGRLVLEGFGVALEVVGDRVAIFDTATGQEQGDYVAVCEALEQEVRAREAAEQQARAATAREQAERQAREEAERRAKDQAAAREAAERQAQAEAEARRAVEQQAKADAEAAAQRIRALEAELARLRGGPPSPEVSPAPG